MLTLAWQTRDSLLKIRYSVALLSLAVCSGTAHAQASGDRTLLLRGRCAPTSGIEEAGKLTAYECDSAVYTENAADQDGFVQFVASNSPDDPPFAFAGDLSSGQLNVSRLYMRRTKAVPAEQGFCFVNRVASGAIESIACGAKASEGGLTTKAVIGFQVTSQEDITAGLNGSASKAPSQSASASTAGLRLNCSGYSNLVHANQTFKFNINEGAGVFSGTMDTLREISGNVSVKGDVITLTFEDRTKMLYTAWIDRSDGSFKLDRSNDKLYLPNDVTGTCAKSAGNAF
jgi:hypothetical protein